MRAKNVNEANFERGTDPKKAMGVGINNYEGYIKAKLHETYPDKDLDKVEVEFWDSFYDGFVDEKSYNIVESLLNILKETPLKYQMEYMEGDLDAFNEGVEAGYINID